MRTGAPAGHAGHFHELCLYDSDTEFVDHAVPFLRGGLDAREPTVVAAGAAHSALLREAMRDDAHGLVFLDDDNYARPSSAIKAYRELLTGLTQAGAGQVRVLGELPPALWEDGMWPWWARYEAAVNQLYDDFPVWTLCAYSTRTPAGVLHNLEQTHPWITTASGAHRRNASFMEPGKFLTSTGSVQPDPVQRDAPSLVATDPAPRAVREWIRQASRDGKISAGIDIGEVQLALTEALTNAGRHGAPPAQLRVWTSAERLVATVSDGGCGPVDPYVGLVPTAKNGAGGQGMWLIHEVADHVTLERAASGDSFTLGMTFRAR